MSTQDLTDRTRGRDDDPRAAVTPRRDRRVSTETKAAFKTTELIAYVVTVIGVLIGAAVVDNADAGGLGAKQAWLYVTIPTVGYMISRGLAKAGSRDFYDDER
jgi:acetyl-CoA carboxylase carboxyltransferase component